MDRTYPKISIVTPSFNQGKFIDSAIQSVLQQNYSNFEHIILDNCSTDRTVEILQQYPHLIWQSKPDRGQSDALNQGFRMATGDIIGWLNADDLYLPECFNKIASSFASCPESDVAYGDYRWIDEQGNIIQFRKELDFDFFILKYLHVLYIPSTSTFSNIFMFCTYPVHPHFLSAGYLKRKTFWIIHSNIQWTMNSFYVWLEKNIGSFTLLLIWRTLDGIRKINRSLLMRNKTQRKTSLYYDTIVSYKKLRCIFNQLLESYSNYWRGENAI